MDDYLARLDAEWQAYRQASVMPLQPGEFTAKSYAEHSGMTTMNAGERLRALHKAGRVTRTRRRLPDSGSTSVWVYRLKE